jgi:hypothetical protein
VQRKPITWQNLVTAIEPMPLQPRTRNWGYDAACRLLLITYGSPDDLAA